MNKVPVEATENEPPTLDDVLGQSYVATFVLDAQLRVVWINAAVEQYLGLSPDSLLGQDKRQIVRENADRIVNDHYDCARRVLASYETNEHLQHMECRVLPGEGRPERWLDYCSRPITEGPYAGGRVEHYADITTYKSTEAALDRQEQEFTILANGIPQLTWMAGPGGEIYWYNRRWYDYTGTTLEEMQAGGWRQILHPDHHERVLARFRQAIQEGQDWEDTFPLRSAESDYRWFLSRALPIRDEAGQVVRWLGTNTDITENLELAETLWHTQARLRQLNATLEQHIKERTQDLERARDRFSTLFHSNPIPTAISRVSDGTFLDTNAAFNSFFGYSRTEFLGHTSTEMNLWDSVKMRDHWLEVLNSQGSLSNVEMQVRVSSGTLHTVLASIIILEIAGEMCALSSVIDITPRIEAEHQAQRLASQMALAEQSERRRIAQILHDDVQQSLVAHQINLHLLGHDSSPEVQQGLAEAAEFVGTIIEETRSLTGELSSPAVHTENLRDGLFWLATHMEERYRLHVEVTADDLCVLPHADQRELLLQLVRELLFNVVKHAGTNSARLHLDSHPRYLVLTVEDDGRGFDTTTALRQVSGGSLGLYSVRERLELFGGSFAIDSAPGEGTRVTLHWPLPPN